MFNLLLLLMNISNRISALIFLLSFVCLLSTTSLLAQQSVSENDPLIKILEDAESINSVRSLLIQQNGERIAEEYFNGASAGQKINSKSASKSIISLLAGIAVDRGIIESVEDRAAKYLPDYFEGITDSTKHEITIKDLLTMRAGLETTSFHNYGRWVISDDWVRYALQQPMEEELGGRMVYSTGTSHILSAIITEASGMSTRTFANEYLFGPLNIAPGGWDRGPEGYYMGGNNLALSPEAMMRIGQMVLNGGTWNGERIVSKEWLADSFDTYTRSNYNPYDYGYMWWNREVGGYKTFFAWGHGGQYIFMLPELDAVVVIMSAPHASSSRREYREPIFDLLGERIIPDILEPGS
jgi:CubicO group peptidase (beta-lactamase class C family)